MCTVYTCTLAVLEMAESELTSGVLKDLQINSYIRGYHAYMDVWTPALNGELILKREPTNETDRNAVAVLKEETVVGHVPFNLAPLILAFLRRDTNCGFAKVAGEKVNQERDMVWRYHAFTYFMDLNPTYLSWKSC